jgi:hypothetical protein
MHLQSTGCAILAKPFDALNDLLALLDNILDVQN